MWKDAATQKATSLRKLVVRGFDPHAFTPMPLMESSFFGFLMSIGKHEDMLALEEAAGETDAVVKEEKIRAVLQPWEL